MDPIITAIVTAVASSLSKDAITDSYNALKAAIKKKFGSKSDIVNAVDARPIPSGSNVQKVKIYFLGCKVAEPTSIEALYKSEGVPIFLEVTHYDAQNHLRLDTASVDIGVRSPKLTFTAIQLPKSLLYKSFENKNAVTHQKFVCSTLLLCQLTFSFIGTLSIALYSNAKLQAPRDQVPQYGIMYFRQVENT